MFVFASEIKALLEHPAVPLAVNEALLPEYLAFGFTSSEETLFRGIRKLMPGHWLMFDAGGRAPVLRVERYWDAPDTAAAARRKSAGANRTGFGKPAAVWKKPSACA